MRLPALAGFVLRALMLKITVNIGDAEDKLDKLPDLVKTALKSEADVIAAILLSIIKGKAGGDVLEVHSGKYLASISSRVRVNPKSVSGSVFSKDPRAGVLEWGGKLPPRDIRPSNVEALHFLMSGSEVFAALVHHRGAVIKPHSVFHSTYLEQKTDILARLIAAGSVAASKSID